MNDSIHGHMQFDPLIFKIIDTPEFQRLRNIKQLGSSNLVYPSATHSRFEHSIGVCHLAGEMLNNLELHTENLTILPKHKMCVKIAALCHDLGHGPMSHSWEIYVRRNQPEDNWSHEQASVLMFKKLLENINHDLSSEDISMIENLIKGFDEESDFTVAPELQYLYEIVNNKYCDMDVDKWDYLIRDSKYTNIPTGFDHMRLLSGVKVIKDVDGTSHISYRDSDAINVSRMYMDRANLHFYCYKHKAGQMAEEMYFDAIALAENDPKLKIRLRSGEEYKFSTAHRNMVAYEQLTDSIIERILWSDCDEAKSLLNRILIRDFYKVIYRKKFSNKDDLDRIEGAKNHILKYLSDKTKLKLGMNKRTMAMGNNGKLKNTPFHNKYGEKVIEQDLQLFSQSGSPEQFWYGEILIFSKENRTASTVCRNVIIDNEANKCINEILESSPIRNGI
ncbi:deoxynucleoside triphosphate triphosphohydrolase SAMHD1 isoform X2 [Ctenocephalides felis]|nr:deoxynucleoside triphosphate triphosphohydrolase SAMHD1 isoform X2 [Ctenocephalides felis]XP_026468087.1 deoxynucleoside triphosphate triphosphohydrolase SAMHD1 isoform X2 [Ctenocephalides felis]